MPHKVKATTEQIKKYYEMGYSCEKVGKMFSMTRQAVWERLRINNIETRKKIVLPFVIYDGIKFTPSEYGYYRSTRRDKHIALHRYKYEKEVGKIPNGYEIHHIDGKKDNNDIKNLECLSKSEHTKKYSPHHNQYKNNKTISSGEWKDK